MRLTDLSPKWVQPSQWASPLPFYIGVTFKCPHCDKRLAVMFDPPIDPHKFIDRIFDWPKYNPALHSRQSGETFETLTITPSIGFDNPPHWHGHITNGEIRT